MSYEAEKAVIGSLLVDNAAIERIYGVLSPEKFTDEVLGRMFYEVKKAYDGNKAIDVTTLRDSIISDEMPEYAVNRVIQECMGAEFVSVNIGRYAEIIARDYRAKVLSDYLNRTRIDGKNVDEAVKELSAVLEDFRPLETDGEMNIAAAVDKYSPERFVANRSQGIALGYGNVDAILQNIDGGDMCIIAARPSVGKSALSTEIALNMAKNGHRVAMFNLEMTNDQVYDRLIANVSGLELYKIRRGTTATSIDRKLYDDGNAFLKSLGDKLILIDSKRRISDMTADMKRYKADVAIIDYAQLIQPESNYRGNRYAEVGAISHSIKWAAKKLKVPIILLAQLNRKSEQTDTKEPTMSELREAGDFEQDASQVILLWNKTEDRQTKGVKIDKNRQGEVGKTELYFDGKTMRFSEKQRIPDGEPTPFD